MPDNASLKSLNVLVTRPEQQQADLSKAIAALGGATVSFPLLHIAPIADAGDLATLQRQIQHLDNYQLLIFISTNAAHYGAALIDSFWPQFPVGVEVLAVGPSTAAAVQDALHCDVLSSETGMNSEALLHLPRLQQVAAQKVAIFRGKGGRELLASTLRERGARVDYFEVYQRQPVSYAPGELVNTIHSCGVNVLSVTSAESLQRLQDLAGNNTDALYLLPLLVPSGRVAGLARDAGFNHVVDAGGANVEAFIEALQEIAARADT